MKNQKGMEKSIIVLLLVCIVLFGAVGCGKSYEYDDLSYRAARYFTIDGAAGGGIALSRRYLYDNKRIQHNDGY